VLDLCPNYVLSSRKKQDLLHPIICWWQCRRTCCEAREEAAPPKRPTRPAPVLVDLVAEALKGGGIQPFSQESHSPTVAKEFQIGLYDPAEADLELFCNSWSAGFLGERL